MVEAIAVPQLAAEGLLLRPWTSDDFDAVLELGRDPAIHRWMGTPKPFAAMQARTFLDRHRNSAAAGTTAGWAVTDGGVVVGLMQLGDLDRDHPEIGFNTLPASRGQRVARRAVRAACRWAFERGAPKVLWLAEVGNEASWRVAQAVGFQYEGLRRAELEQAGRGRVDAWSASLLPADLDGDHPLPFGPDPVLADGEVTVRRYQEADVGPWLALRNEPDVIARGYGGDRRRPLSGNEAWRELMVEGTEMRMTGRGMELAVVAGETLVGNMSFQRFGAGASLSWWSGAAARGRGTTSHAVRLLVAHLRGVGVPRVEARIHVANVASQRVAERAGLVRQGLLPRDAPWDDGPGDAYLYGTSLAEPVGKEAGDSAESRSTP